MSAGPSYAKIFCMDALPYGSGICQVDEAEEVVAELWRRSEAVSDELGVGCDPSVGHEPEPHLTDVQFPVPKSLRDGFLFDCIELFKGEGNWSNSHSHSAIGLCVHPGVDLHGWEESSIC